MPTALLNQKLRMAILTYYFNRQRQNDVKWNKEADLQAIENSVPKGYGFEAIAGTFFFKRYTKIKIHYYETNEQLFPEFKYTCKKRKQS